MYGKNEFDVGVSFKEKTQISQYIPMSQVRITDKRLIPQIKEYLEQSVGSLITESDVLNYILQRYPEYITNHTVNPIDIAEKIKPSLQKK